MVNKLEVANNYEEAGDFFLKGDDGEGTAEIEAVKNYEKAIAFARNAGSFARVRLLMNTISIY